MKWHQKPLTYAAVALGLLAGEKAQSAEVVYKPKGVFAAAAQQASSADSSLETNIDAYIKDLRRRGTLAPTDKTSFVVYDIDHDRKVASINQDERMMAASTIKDFVMLAYFHEVKQGRLNYTNSDKKLLRAMIQKSDNRSTNALISRLGGPKKVEQILAANYSFFDETDVVEYIPRGGRTYKNTTSAHDLNIFYNQLWRGNLPYADEMKKYLALPKRDRLFDGTCIPNGTMVLNKTGTVYGLVADSGILVMKDAQGKAHPYAITAMIEDQTKTNDNRRVSFGRWAGRRSEAIRSISEGAYDYLSKMHGKEFMCRQHKGHHLGGRQ